MDLRSSWIKCRTEFSQREKDEGMEEGESKDLRQGEKWRAGDGGRLRLIDLSRSQGFWSAWAHKRVTGLQRKCLVENPHVEKQGFQFSAYASGVCLVLFGWKFHSWCYVTILRVPQTQRVLSQIESWPSTHSCPNPQGFPSPSSQLLKG